MERSVPSTDSGSAFKYRRIRLRSWNAACLQALEQNALPRPVSITHLAQFAQRISATATRRVIMRRFNGSLRGDYMDDQRNSKKPRRSIAERFALAELEAEGYEVLDKGWPDFLAYKDGKIRLVEVKQNTDQIRPEQRRMAEILESLGFPVEIKRYEVAGVYRPNRRQANREYLARLARSR